MSTRICTLLMLTVTCFCLSLPVNAEIISGNALRPLPMDVIYEFPPAEPETPAALDPEKTAEADSQSESGKQMRQIPEPGQSIFFGRYDQDENPENGLESISWQVIRVLKGSHRKIELISSYVPEGLETAESAREWLDKEFVREAFTDEERSTISDIILLDEEKYERYKKIFVQNGISSEFWYLRPVIRLDLDKWLSSSEELRIKEPVIIIETQPVELTATAEITITPVSANSVWSTKNLFILAAVIVLLAAAGTVTVVTQEKKIKKNKPKAKSSMAKPQESLTDLNWIPYSIPGTETAVMGMDESYHCAGCRGKGKRDYQEDSLWYGSASPGKTVCAVIADGMGGMDNGAESSAMAIASFETQSQSIRTNRDIPSQLYEICKNANDKIYETNYAKDMNGGSTLISVFITENKLYWISIGDSRIYLYRDGVLAAVNEEHELENRMYSSMLNGEIELKDIREIQERELRKLTSNLGRSSIPMVDQNYTYYQLHEGDKLLLCSDGVSGTLNENEMSECLKDPNPDINCDRIVEMVEAKDKRGQDNYSAIVVLIAAEC